MASKSRDIMPPTPDDGAPAPASTRGSDPTAALRNSARDVKSTPPAPTDQSSTSIDPRRTLGDKISTIGVDGHRPGVAI